MRVEVEVELQLAIINRWITFIAYKKTKIKKWKTKMQFNGLKTLKNNI